MAVVVLVVAIWVDLDVNQDKENRAMTTFTNTLRALFMIAFIFGQQSIFAQTTVNTGDASTAALVALCKNTNDVDAQNFCFGFGEGVYQAYLANQNPKVKPRICFGENAGTRQVILEQFLTWNQTHPQFNQERAAKTLMRFFAQQYPCK